jgi:tetratricopeptide (TPR) repeat protein
MATFVLAVLISVPAGQDARAEAERLARSGQRQQALERFQALAAENPADIQARLWIGRLHLDMDHPLRAVAVYESIVATEGRNVDALVGLGVALTRTGRLREAGEALARAETIAADRVDVLVAQGALHTIDQRESLALAYYGRVLAIEPGNAEAKAAADVLRAARAHRIEVDYDFQTFNDNRDDTQTGTIEGNFRVSDVFRVFGKAQVHAGEADTESRAGGGVEWAPAHGVWLRAGALFGSDTIEIPELDTFASLSLRQQRATWTLEGRFVQFDEADLWIGGPRLDFALNKHVTAFASYQRGRATFDFGDVSTSNNSTLGLGLAFTPRVRTVVEYRHGIDRQDWITFDRINAGDANTFSAGLGVDLTPFVTLDAHYDYQTRPDDFQLQRARARMVLRF